MTLNGEELSWCRYGQVFEDAKKVLNSFHGWEVRYVKRDANMAAHGLAKEATRIVMDRAWIEETSNNIFDIVNVEQLALAL
jgi:cystathionine beta-lyase/cystathionine gamma-synthase